jgi:hypothetical protein
MGQICNEWEETLKKHGDRPKGEKKRLYNIWSHMKERCNNVNHVQYKSYGGRGIKVCDEWNDYASFRTWAMNSGYSDELTLDRKNNDEGYSPDNCKWSTSKEQANNRRDNHILTLNGESHNIEWWASKTGLPRHAIDGRIRRGWDDVKTLTTPLLTKGGKVREPRNNTDEADYGGSL